MTNCPYCGKLTDLKLESCPHCGGYIQKKGPASPPKSTKGSNQTCQNCHALVQDGDIICVACGTNLLTGQKIADENQQGKSARQALSTKTVAVAAGFVVAVVVVIAAFLWLSRDPMRGIMSLANAGNYLQAGNDLKNFVQKHPNDADAIFLLGKIQWQMDDFASAGPSFEKAFELQPKNLKAGLLAVLGLAATGDSNAARDKQILILNKLSQSFPDNEDVQRLRALYLGVQNDAAAQTAALKELLSQNPEDATGQAAMAISLALEGDYRAALRESKTIEEKDGNSIAAQAFITDLNGQPEEALPLLDAAVEGGTVVQADALVRAAAILIAQGNFAEAEKKLTNAISLSRNDSTAQYYHAVCLYAQGATAEALREFDAVAQQQSPHVSDALAAAASIYLSQGDASKARDVIERAIKAGASDAMIRTLQGRIYAASNEEDKAREAFTDAIATNPDYAPAHLENGLLFIKQQFFSEGLKELERYLALIDDDAPANRRPEIEMLVTQLKQASGNAAPSKTQSTSIDERS